MSKIGMFRITKFVRLGLIGAALAGCAAEPEPLPVSGDAAQRPPRPLEDSAGQSGCHDKDDGAVPYSITVEGETATGHVALPASGRLRGLVVFFHGYGHTSVSWKPHLAAAARDLNVIAVAMDYRGTEVLRVDDRGLEVSRGWRVAEGAVDSIAAAQQIVAACKPPVVVAHAVSMGGNAGGLAVAAGATRPDGRPLFDWWIDVEGANNVIETYLAARTLAPASPFIRQALEDIEAEMGGPIEQRPEVYADRTNVLRIEDIAASGVRGVVLIHGLDDGLVPYDQSLEMAAALRAAGVGTDFFTVGRRDEQTEQDTTITGAFAEQIDEGWRSPLVGHASEASSTHIIMRLGFARLAAILAGATPRPGCQAEYTVDGELGVQPAYGAAPCL